MDEPWRNHGQTPYLTYVNLYENILHK